MKYAIFDHSGRIDRLLNCTPGDLILNLRVGEDSLQAGELTTNDDHYVLGGQLVKPPLQPSPAHVFDYAAKQWVDPRTLADMKALKWGVMKAARTAVINAPLVTPYGTFDSGPKDRANITDAVLMLQTLASIGNPQNITFTLTDNTAVTLTTKDIVSVALLLGQKVQGAYSTSRTLRARIEAATTAVELESIVW